MRFIFKSALLVTSLFTLQSATSQIQDNWDTVYKAVSVAPFNYFAQCNNFVIGNKMYLYGDTINSSAYTPKSFIEVYNPATATVTPVAYTRVSTDYGLNGGASIPTTTAGVSYMFFGTKLNGSVTSSVLSLYKMNSQTNAVSAEQYTYATSDYRQGIKELCFFSPLSNHDSLLIFDDSISNYSILFKKKFNQPGILNTKIVLPVSDVRKAFVFNNVLYVSGTDPFTSSPTMLNSSDGINFTTNASYTANVYYKTTTMDTLNGKLYMGVTDGDGGYYIYVTADGVNYTFVTGGSGNIMSFKAYKGRMWYSVSENSGRPTVKYVGAPPNYSITESIFEIGRPENDGYTFKLNVLNSELYLPGNYANYNQTFMAGDFIYKLLLPQASFSLASNQLCYNTTYSISNQSVNADSVRWGLDGNYFYSNSQNFLSFSSVVNGSHTLSLIAFGGTQSDTLNVPFTIYLPVVSLTGTTTPVCQNTIYNYTASVSGGVGALSFNWLFSPGISVVSSTGSIGSFSVATGGNYTVNLQVTDAQGCLGPITPFTFTSTPAKAISGVASTTAAPVAGEIVTLYRYEPVLTKFDSITSQTTDAAGGYTFTNAPAYTYLLKCDPANNSTLQVTYSPSALNWKTASILTHGCSNNTTQNINVIELANIGTGSGSLSGKIVEGVGYGNKGNQTMVPGNPIKGVVVKGGKNPGGEIFTQSRTNAAGQYTLQGMPLNGLGEEYFILVDIPGLDTNNTYHKVLDAANPSYGNLDFFVDSAKINPTGIVGIKEVIINNNRMLVYPNPTNGNINIEISLNQSSLVKIDVMDLFGRIVQNIVPQDRFNDRELKVNSTLSGIKPGVYFINVKIDDANRTTKIIVTE